MMSSGPCACVVEPLSSLEALLNCSPSPICSHRDYKLSPVSLAFAAQKVGLDGSPKSHPTPKLIVCHDLKGGYLDDKFVCGRTGTDPNNYVFRHWAQTDFFIYFSHNFVTIPPAGWTHAAHLHGVKVLGTIITEWKDGEAICKGFLEDASAMDQVVNQLIRLTVHYGFDGYLLNIENKVDNVECLLNFISLLRMRLREVSTANTLFFYDSVIVDGSLSWQDELNHRNKPFFDACDGLFLNYCWDAEKLARSVQLSGERREDVFVGVDVFGRNCFGGGGLNTHKALQEIDKFGLSVAIFAPGWTYERFAWEEFIQTDNEMWGRCAPYFSYRVLQGPTTEAEAKDKDVTLILHTSFSLGYGRTRYRFGLEVEDGCPWFDLHETSYQPVLIPTPYLSRSQSAALEDADSPLYTPGDATIPLISIPSSSPREASSALTSTIGTDDSNSKTPASVSNSPPVNTADSSTTDMVSPTATYQPLTSAKSKINIPMVSELTNKVINPEVSADDSENVGILTQGNPDPDRSMRCGGTYETEVGFIGGGCLSLVPAATPTLWFPLQIHMDAAMSLVLLLVWRGQEEPNISLRTRSTHGLTNTICQNESPINLPNRRVEVELRELMSEKYPPDIRFRFGPSPSSTKTLNGWTLSASLFESESEEICQLEGICVGVQECGIQLGYLSLARLRRL